MDHERTKLSIYDHSGMVILEICENEKWRAQHKNEDAFHPIRIPLDVDMARSVGECLAKCAYTAKYGISADKSKSLIAQEKRMLLTTRVTHMIRTFNEKKTLPGVMANSIVDRVLEEIM